MPMARLIPELGDRQLDAEFEGGLLTSAEVRFVRWFRQLDDAYTVFMSREVIRDGRGQTQRIGGPVFCVTSHTSRIHLISVWGSQTAYNVASGEWTSSDRLEAKWLEDFSCPGTLMTSYWQEMKATAECHSPGCTTNVFVGMMVLVSAHATAAKVQNAVVAVFDELNLHDLLHSTEDMPPQDGQSAHDFSAWLLNSWTNQRAGIPGLAKLGYELSQLELDRITLLRSQENILRLVRTHPRALISGMAGTGKTLLAKQLAWKFADHELRVLFLCHNTGLADHLGRMAEHDFSARRDRLHVMTSEALYDIMYRKLSDQDRRSVGELIRQRTTIEQRSTENQVRALQMFYSLNACGIGRFGAVVVDEGQDIPAEMWKPVKCLLNRPDQSPMVVFYDNNQAIYELALANSPTLKRLAVLPPLTVNCRNTNEIFGAFRAFYRGVGTSFAILEGPKIEFLSFDSAGQQAEAVCHRIAELLPVLLPPRHGIAVLVNGRDVDRRAQLLMECGKRHGLSFEFRTHTDSGKPRIDTVARFKGLEADVVFLWLAEAWNSPRIMENKENMLYVGLSRAKSVLIVVGTRHDCGGIKDRLGRRMT